MNGQVGQSVGAGGDVAGRAAGQPDDVAAGKNLLTVRRTDDAATGDDDEYDVEIRLGVGVHALTGRQVNEVRIELATRLAERPPRTRRHGPVIDEFMHVGQDPYRRPLAQEVSWNTR